MLIKLLNTMHSKCLKGRYIWHNVTKKLTTTYLCGHRPTKDNPLKDNQIQELEKPLMIKKYYY